MILPAAILTLAVFLGSGDSVIGNRYSTNWCKGRSAATCISSMIEGYDEWYVIGNRALAHLFLVNPQVFLDRMSRNPDTLTEWLGHLEVFTFRSWAGSVESELDHAANLRLKELMIATAEEFANGEQFGPTATTILDYLRTVRVELLERDLTNG